MSIPNDFQKPKLPAPKIPDQYQRLTVPHFSTPSGMLLSSALQPPPMYGLRGSTIPPKFLSKPPPTFKELIVEHPYKKPVQEEFQLSFFCDFCDKSFRYEEKLEKHKLQSHKELMGIKPRVYTEEEINEWKEARKKRYPTTQNVIARQQAQEERIKRGERLEKSKSRFGKTQDRRPISRDNSFQRRNNKSGALHYKNKKPFIKKLTVEFSNDETESETLDGLSKFQGTASLKNYERTKILKQTNALTCLGSYGSGTESESEQELQDESVVEDTNEGPEETPIVKVDPFTDANIASIPNHRAPPKDLESQESSKRRNRKRKHSKDETPSNEPNCSEPNCSESLEVQINTNEKPLETREKINRTRTAHPPWFRRYRRYQNTMLEKLLEPEIRHERNVLLQCTRFVVENNFFGIGAKTETNPNTEDTDKNNE